VTRQAKLVLVLLSIAVTIASAQSSPRDRSAEQDTQTRGYWVDPSTGLMWAGKDNGRDVSWHRATEYCTNSRLAGYSDWKLATINELLGIYEPNAKAPGENQQPRKHLVEAFSFDIKGNIFLTGDQWSSSLIKDDRGFSPEFAWFLCFNEGRRIYDELNFAYTRRALCVRRSVNTPAPPSATSILANVQPSSEVRRASEETLTRGYWIDPSTKLMWAAKDNFKDVSWRKAVKYCSDLRIGGYTDWRLANIDELQGIYEKNAESPGVDPRSKWHGAEYMAWHVKGNLFLTGDLWSNSQLYDDRKKPSGYASRFDFNEGRKFDGDEVWFGHHALCQRDSAK